MRAGPLDTALYYGVAGSIPESVFLYGGLSGLGPALSWKQMDRGSGWSSILPSLLQILGVFMNEDLVYRLRKRAEIRRQISTRKSVQENAPDRIADLLEEAANRIEQLEGGQDGNAADC